MARLITKFKYLKPDERNHFGGYAEYIATREGVEKIDECWPAIPTIATDLKLSASTVRRGIRDLKKAGLLETEQRYRKKGGKSSLLFRLKKE